MAIDEFEAMSLQPLETPPLKVSRPVAACSRCRNAKIKCDGKLPACSSCEKNGRAAECTSTNDNFARGKERSYVSTLETRLDRLQARLEDARARKPSVVSIPDDETAVPSRRPSQQIPDEPPTPNTSRVLKRKEGLAIDDLVSDFGFLSVNATARDFYGFTTAMSYARLILSACTKEDLPQGTTKALPPRHIATALIQHYLNNIFVLLPVFDEASFYASVDNVYSKEIRKADPLDHWLVRLVLAVASASKSQSRGDEQYVEGIGHVCAALDFAEAVLHPGNISGVQALVLLAEYAMLDPHHFDSWSLIGAASRAITDLGLHQDPPKGTPMLKGKLELRRRVFHCIYTLDRSTSLVQTRAFSFSDDSAKVKVPFTRQPNSPPSSPPAGPATQWLQSYEQALELINLRRLQSSWYTDLFQSGRTRWEDPYTYLWDTCDSMRKWYENLSASTDQNMRAFFELELLYSYVYILSPSPRISTIQPYAQKLIFEYCIRYADLMLHLISDPAYTAPLTFYDAMRVYMTGRQFLDVLQHNTDMLLNALMPPNPEVKPAAAAPPQIPVVPPPRGETLQRFTLIRSINCIRQITECLARFGIRWGYMSWNQRFQNETAEMLTILNSRLREMDEMNAWRPYGPMGGSIPSSNGSVGSISYHSPPSSQRMSGPPMMYQTTPPPMRQTPSYEENSAPLYQPGTVQYQQQPQMYSQQQQQQHPHSSSNYAQVPPQQYQQQLQQTFNFHEPAYQNAAYAPPPNQQFAAWSGYSGPVVPSKLDEDNAYSIAPEMPLDATGQQYTPTNIQQELQPSPRLPQPRRGPSPRALSSRLPSQAELESIARVDTREASVSQRYSYEIPKTCILPPLTGMGSAGASISSASHDLGRRTSMHDAATDVLQSTYPPATPIQPPPTDPRHPSVIGSMPPPPRPSLNQHHSAPAPAPAPPRRDKGKGRAKDPPLYTNKYRDPAGQFHAMDDGFEFRRSIGYVCVVCGQVCPKPGLHYSTPNGGRCLDLSDPFEGATTMMGGESVLGRGVGQGQVTHEAYMQNVASSLQAVEPTVPAPAQEGRPVFDDGTEETERRLSEGAGLFF